MKNMLLRPLRKNLKMKGLIYLAGEELVITIENISMTGVFVKLHQKEINSDSKQIVAILLETSNIDLHLPDIQMSGEARVIRVAMQSDQVLFALEFRNVTFDVNNGLYKRKAYRKNYTGSGQILLDGNYLDYIAVNVSVQGILIRLNQFVYAKPGAVTHLLFSKLELDGDAEVMWLNHVTEQIVLMGLQYIRMNKSEIKGIPQFS
jgi:hypothetical protein